ncbi:TPA: phage antirepressor KilAC domain-containing protein [Escherichia coli]|uniref:phage antirepressor KilAC domain-containing protein n=1 Tax=Escherichia coli TaxID=562 RepID=UPI0014826BA4|nr:phage antirepressor KilAC domain-containing protein [Escherichia coli]EGI6799922.1 phage regulatory protein/antirepressor Ant [Escherichia coli]NNS63414.1 phage regulatory protein/antirepressor Ant [Escherichia coli]NNS91259.1 phage regulatory protein/antirepressor Ant [Escherichia coli]NNS96098.1 phage regulatory protein/antirepressor Ant [Escherichia coli]NNT11526.1 phage regulatory protein/antirepressor Ant [Escherichia coli]
MNQLINVKNDPGFPAMTSLEIAGLCEKRHDHVCRDIKVMLEQLNIQSPQIWGEYRDDLGRAYPCFHLPKDLCLTLVSGYNVILRKRIIDRWLELEQESKPAIPQSFSEALRLAADLEEQKQRLSEELAVAAPKAEFVDRYVTATGSMTFRQVAKLLNAKEPEFRLFLLDSHIMYRLNNVLTPYHQHTEAGRFEVKTGTTNASNYAFSQSRFTAKGVKWIGGLWAEYLAKGHAA